MRFLEFLRPKESEVAAMLRLIREREDLTRSRARLERIAEQQEAEVMYLRELVLKLVRDERKT